MASTGSGPWRVDGMPISEQQWSSMKRVCRGTRESEGVDGHTGA